ncbi:MAG: hypothetical protein ACREJO_00495 [Phycisphaerales bacterium]
MFTIGIDAHFMFYAVCVLDGEGQVVKECTIRGGPDAVAGFVRELGEPARACLEASCGYACS